MLIFWIEVNSHKVTNRVTKFMDCKSARIMIHEDLLLLRLENSTQGTRKLVEQGLTLMSRGLNRIQHFGDEVVAMRDENVQVKLAKLFHMKLIGSVSNSPTNGFRMDIRVLMFQPREEKSLLLWLWNRSDIDSHGGEIKRKVLLTLSLIKMNCVAKSSKIEIVSEAQLPKML